MTKQPPPQNDLDGIGDWIAGRLLSQSGVEERRSRFADKAALFTGGTEFFHLDSPGLADVRLTRATIRAHRDELRRDPRVALRADAGDWINITFASGDDAEAVLRWAMLALEANA